uniref:Zinc finger protein RFP-like n=1 Tax=Calidris pygmaea TaxID=425635 RepID=A0A8C3PPF6_9CHAR
MAARKPVEILQDEAHCSICLEIFQDPVSIHCGHSFCRSCITETWEGLTTNFSCPQCRETVSWKRLRPNRELANMVEAAKRLNLQQDREVEGGENFCEEHQEPLKLFCQDDKRLICVVCDRSKVHRDHSVVPMGEAAQECKVRGVMGVLRYKGPEAPDVGQKIVRTYRKMHEFLEKQESSLLAQLEQLDTEIRKAHEEILQRLLEETTRLGTLIGEMERTYQQPDWQLLKVRAQAFQTGWEAIKQGLEKVPGTEGRSRKGNAIVLLGGEGWSEAQMTLDPETANPWLYLSKDCKLVRSKERPKQNLPSNPKRFKVNHCVLGSRGFTSGWHRWDVEVHGEGVWAIGVAKESVPRDREFVPNPSNGIWALHHTHNEYVALTSPCVTRLTLRRVPKRIRICLDYEEGRVVFFDAKSKERIFAFPPASFQGERVFPCFMVMFDAQLKLLP